MIEDDAYPMAVPLSRADAQELVAHPERYPSVPGAFLSFVMLAVEDRVGVWRFAGTSASLSEALHRLGEFAVELKVSDSSPADILLEWLGADVIEIWTDIAKAWSLSGLPTEEIGAYRVVLFGEGQAPYDDMGFCVLEIPSLENSPFRDRAPETKWPEREVE